VEKYGTARQATDDNIIRRMRFACWIHKATGTHSEYVIFIAFLLQQNLHERAAILRYTDWKRNKLVLCCDGYCRFVGRLPINCGMEIYVP